MRIKTEEWNTNKVVELRDQPWLSVPLPIKLRGVDVNGEAFDIETVLDSISRGALHVRLGRQVKQGKSLFVVVNFKITTANGTPSTRVAILGTVMRSEMQPNGICALAIKCVRYRFL